MKKSLLLITSISAGIMFSGCATIVGGGSSQQLSIQTSQPEVVTVGHTKDGNTIIDPKKIQAPAIVTVKRENKNILIKTKDGNTKIVKKKLNPWFLGNVIFGGVVGSTTDAVTGSMWKYDKNVNLNTK